MKLYEAQIRDRNTNAVFPVQIQAENDLQAVMQINSQYGAENVAMRPVDITWKKDNYY